MVKLSDYNHLEDWSSANKALDGAKSKKIGNNTELRKLPNNDIVITLHENRIVRYHADGRVRISDGGHKSRTTKDRLNRYTPSTVRVVQRSGVWYVKMAGKKVKFQDGMAV